MTGIKELLKQFDALWETIKDDFIMECILVWLSIFKKKEYRQWIYRQWKDQNENKMILSCHSIYREGSYFHFAPGLYESNMWLTSHIGKYIEMNGFL